MKRRVLKNTRDFVKQKLTVADGGHDFFHIERVIKNAKLINQTEKGDWFVIEIAILLHDVGDRKVIKKPDDDYSIAENFLISQKLDSALIKKVMFIIEHMSFSKNLENKLKIKNKELEIVEDADRLDAIGAIGIGRTFTYGGSKNQGMYDPKEKPIKYTNSEKYKKSKSTTVNHFYEKLFLLKDLMNTKTGKKIAIKRHKFMQDFVKVFLAEWNGER